MARSTRSSARAGHRPAPRDRHDRRPRPPRADDAELLGVADRRSAPRRAAGHHRRARPADRGDRIALPGRSLLRSMSASTWRPDSDGRPMTTAVRRRGRPTRPRRRGRRRIHRDRGRADRWRSSHRRARRLADDARTSRQASSTSTSTAGAATTRWATAAALDGMARALLRRGVTSFLPTAGHGAAAGPRDVRGASSRLAARRARGWRRAARVQPRGPVPGGRSARRPRRGPPARPRGRRVRGARAARRRASARDDRAGARGGGRSHPLVHQPWRGDVARPLGGERRSKPEPATTPARPRRPTCSTR